MIANTQTVQAPFKHCAIAGIAITEEILRRLIPREGFGDLLSDSFRSRVEGSVRPNQLPALQVDDGDAIHELEADRGNHKQVDRHQDIFVVLDEGLPCLLSRPRMSTQIVADLSH